jgi:hypothetical protein
MTHCGGNIADASLSARFIRADTHAPTKEESMVYTVSIYLIDLAYGGPEEGGWFYRCGEPQATEHTRAFKTRKAAVAYRERLAPALAALNEGLPPISSVNSQGRYDAIIDEDALPAPFPAERPFYS